MKVEFFRHGLSQKNIGQISRVIETPFLTTGATTAEFEKRLAGYLGQAGCVGLTSATAALHLSLLVLDVGPGDEVITTPLTFVATALAVMHAGAKPVFVDVEEDTGNINADLIPEAITGNTKAVIPVHLYGQMVDMEALASLSKKYDLKLIEDAAHCLEGQRDGHQPGDLADTACFSFYATKSITSGEGGAAATNNSRLEKRLRTLSIHGMTTDAVARYDKLYRHYDVVEHGWKYNMSNIQAALLLDQLDDVEAKRLERERIALTYREALSGQPGIEMPSLKHGVKQAHHLFTIWVDPHKRDSILHQLQEEGVGVAVNYRACHLYTLFREKFGCNEGQFPVAEEIGARTISLPLYPSLTDKEQDYVISRVKCIVSARG